MPLPVIMRMGGALQQILLKRQVSVSWIAMQVCDLMLLCMEVMECTATMSTSHAVLAASKRLQQASWQSPGDPPVQAMYEGLDARLVQVP